jgi:NADH-quinone oxidoreductase subunit N
MQGIPGIQSLIITTSILSLMVGSIGALNQSKLKRVLAYSAISHTGFLLAGLSTNSIEGYIAVIIYNFIYIIMGFNTLALLASILPGSSN